MKQWKCTIRPNRAPAPEGTKPGPVTGYTWQLWRRWPVDGSGWSLQAWGTGEAATVEEAEEEFRAWQAGVASVTRIRPPKDANDAA